MKIKIGMRTIKTALAVSLSVLLSQIMHLEFPFYAAIASIIVMQAYTRDTLSSGKNRMLGTFAGVCMGAAFAMIPFNKAVLSGVGIIILFCLCNLLKWEKSIGIAGVVFMRIMVDLENESPLKFGMNRLFDTLVGICIALLVNFLFFPYHHSDKIESYFVDFEKKISHILNKTIVLNGNTDIDDLKKDISLLKKHLDNNLHEFKLKRNRNNELLRMKDNLAAYEEMATHLKIIQKIEDDTCLNDQNKAKLKALDNYSFDNNEYTENEINIVYNYHVGKIIDCLQKTKKAQNQEETPKPVLNYLNNKEYASN